MVKNRPASFVIMTVIYLLASVLGICLYNYFNAAVFQDFRLSLFAADFAATVFVFIFSLIFRNASVYDPYWSVQPIVILVAFAIAKVNAGKSLSLLDILLLIAVCYWGIRLTANWAYTFANLTAQDWRYTMLHEKTGFFYPVINFIGIHMVPTVVVYLCILPAVIAVTTGAEFKPLCTVFVLMSVCAATIQLIADIQMQKFRKSKVGGFIRNGLWKHARHPNYFGEITMWWGIGLASFIAMPDNWMLLIGAFANTLLFCCVSIPMAEGRQGKKPGFAEYKKETRILI